jgi:3-hydroxybutyryl-CoA dehydrogenase
VSEPNPFQTVAVLGAGAAGVAIARVVAASGRQVAMLDIAESHTPGVAGATSRQQDDTALLDRIWTTAAISDLAVADLVIESLGEDLELTKTILAEVAAVVGEQVPLCTNTFTLPVTNLAAALPNPERVAGLHFLDHAPYARAVEVVRALQTADETIDCLVAFVDTLGDKVSVVVKDRPALLINALLMPYLNDVIQEYDDELATAEDIDLALKLGLGYQHGPLELLDAIGLDEHLRATDAAYKATRDPRYVAPPLLRQMVAANHLGAKNGKGFRVTPMSTENS